MKTLFRLLLLLASVTLTLFLYSCENENPVPPKGSMTCKVNDQNWTANSFENVLKADSTDPTKTQLTLRGIASNGSIIHLTLYGEEAGTFEFEQGIVQEWLPNYTVTVDGLTKTDIPAKGTLEITKLDKSAHRIAGKFSFTTKTPVQPVSNTITEGVFENLYYRRE